MPCSVRPAMSAIACSRAGLARSAGLSAVAEGRLSMYWLCPSGLPATWPTATSQLARPALTLSQLKALSQLMIDTSLGVVPGGATIACKAW